jgi:hypothetical protein
MGDGAARLKFVQTKDEEISQLVSAVGGEHQAWSFELVLSCNTFYDVDRSTTGFRTVC